MEVGRGVLLCLLQALLLVNGGTTDTVTLDTPLGSLTGLKKTVSGKPVNVFLGVPFAQPPKGMKRFMPPEDISQFEGGSWDARKKPKTCMQVEDTMFGKFPGVDMWNANTEVSEDCLYLNVWAPPADPAKKRAVLVWIYGGGFFYGTSTLDIYDGRILAAENDIIVVSMQYRVGPFGFLYLDRPEVPGNVGLLDQLSAIKWVYNNIDAFGGDKDQITLFGESAGSVSVSLHLLSPLSKDVFKYAIMQSGSALARWAYDPPERAKQHSLAIARKAGCGQPDVSEVIMCLMKVDPLNLTRSMWSVSHNDNLVTPLSFTLDGNFLRDTPHNLINTGNYKQTKLLIGGNKDEGIYFLAYALPMVLGRNRDDNIPLTKQQYLKGMKMIAQNQNPLIQDSINFEYTTQETYGIPVKYADVLDDMMGDLEFICPTIQFGQSYVERGNNIYLYHFLHRTSGNPWPKWMGVMHGYEVDHVFGIPLTMPQNYTTVEQQLSRQMMTFWTNFAKTG